VTRNVVFLVAGAGLLLLGVAELVGGGCSCTIHDPLSWTGTVSKDGVELPHKATLHLSSKDRPARISLDLEMASIVVEGDAKVTGIEADYEVREKTPGDASLAAAPDGVLVKSAGGNPVLVVSVKLRVQPGTEVDVSTNLGAVSVSGIHGAASVVAKTDSGRLALADLADVPKVNGETNLGEVTLTKGAGLGEVTLTTDCGAVEIGDVRAARARLHTDLGEVTARRSTFDHLSAHSDCGAIHLVACRYKTKDVGTDLGSVKEDE
jgi:hypothetical protein